MTTLTGEYHPDEPNKEIVRKRLSTIWGKLPHSMRYFPRGTLLIDDSPYKAQGNPPHTSVHPHTWAGARNDGYLREGGPLRTWLLGLKGRRDVPSYVAATPFPPSSEEAPMPAVENGEPQPKRQRTDGSATHVRFA